MPGPRMQLVADYVSRHPGCAKLPAARYVGPHGSVQYGYRTVDRAIASGLIRARRLPSGRYQLLPGLACGHRPSPHGEHTTGTCGLPDGREVCWTCGDAWQREQMRTSDTCFAYLASDGQSVTSWSGGVLARVTQRTERKVGFHRTTRIYLHAVDTDGRKWHGTSPGPGMYVRLYATKTS